MTFRPALLLAAFAADLCTAPSAPAAWPDKPVRLIVPFAPGGGTDIIARIIAPLLSQEFGQQFVVDNRSGAGGSLGAEILVRAEPDGYTLSLVASSYATDPVVYKLPYDPLKAVTAVSLTDSGPFFFTVNPSLKVASVKEFIALARGKPGALNYGSSGTGGTLHLAGELFAQMTKTSLVHVPYKGTGPAVIDLIAGQTQFIFANGPSVLPYIKSGKLQAIAVTTRKRSGLMPELPAVAETVPGYLAITWHGMLAPAGLPAPIASRLNAALVRALKQPKVQEILASQGLEATPSTPAEFAQLIADDIARWTSVMKKP